MIFISNPLVSIVIAVFNGNSKNYNIKRAMDSVLNQTYKNIELVVVDGVSTDGTVELVKKYQKNYKKKIAEFIFVSEKDNGLYDAMNKGTKLAQELIYFLIDDYFGDNDNLDVVNSYNKEFDFVYGNIY